LASIDDDRFPFAKGTLEHLHGQRIEDAALNGPLERPRAIRWIVTLAEQGLLGGVGELNKNLALLQAAHQPTELDVDDLLHEIAPQRMEEDDLVDAVQELWTEVFA